MEEIAVTNQAAAGATEVTPDASAAKLLKKRGRKASPNKKVYFGEDEERAFADYVNSTDQNFRNRVFSQKLYKPFTKMIESIIRRYNLFTPDEDFDDTFFDTMSFLITKINNFDTSKNKKAYSYCGTICKNYLILKRTQYTKKTQKQASFDAVFPNGEPDYDSSEKSEVGASFNNDLINTTISQLQDMLLPENEQMLNGNEREIGNALLEMLMNWEEIFKYLGSKKFNKSCVLQFIRDYTDLPTKEIREGMRKYKDLYIFTKQMMINGDYVQTEPKSE